MVRETSHKLTPIMVDGSIFSSEDHLEKIVASGDRFNVSSTLFQLLFEDSAYERREIFSSFGWADLPPTLPETLRETLIPYAHKIEYVSLLLDKVSETNLNPQLTSILLDEYSFLKENSSLLLRTRRTLRYLRDLGVTILDLSNRAYNVKHKALQKLEGPRWLLAMAVAGSGISQITSNPTLAGVSLLGGVFITVMDP